MSLSKRTFPARLVLAMSGTAVLVRLGATMQVAAGVSGGLRSVAVEAVRRRADLGDGRVVG